MSAGAPAEYARAMRAAIETRVCVNPPSGRWMNVGFTKRPAADASFRLIETTSYLGPCTGDGDCVCVCVETVDVPASNRAIAVSLIRITVSPGQHHASHGYDKGDGSFHCHLQ
jgi:hypothetical protein